MTNQYEQPTERSLWLWPGEAPGEDVAEPVDDFRPWLDPYPVACETPRGAVIIVPGGGYSIRAKHEGGAIAERFNSFGLHAFVCHYRVSPHRHPGPLLDAARAVRMVRAGAETWKVKPDKIAVLGFSAGGHLTGHLGTRWADAVCEFDDELQRIDCRPDAIIPCYGVLDMCTHVGSYRNLLGENCSDEQMRAVCPAYCVNLETPPAFLWSTADDQVVPVSHSLNFAKKLAEAGIDFELHVFPHGRHGLGLAEGTPDVSKWSELCGEWLTSQGW